MRICRFYKFEIEFEERATLPPWKGNLIRGVIGLHLKRKFCLREDGKCDLCSMIFRCPYGYLYKTPSKGLVLKKISGFTKPYVIKPPLTSEMDFSEGDSLTFSLVLFGDAVSFENPLFMAVKDMCRHGLGVKGKKGRLVLRRVAVENPFRREREIFYENGKMYKTRSWISERDLSIRIGRMFMLRFLTPFRLIREGRLLRDPSFRDLMSFMSRKLSAIYHQYLMKEPGFNAEEVLKSAERIKIIESSLREVRFRYKGEEQVFLLGDMVCSGAPTSWIRKSLAFCQLSHVGKRSSFGFGWYKVVS